MRRSLILISLAGVLAAAGCGGGGGGSSTPPPTPNRAPVFTSAASVSVEEGVTGEVYTFEVNDPDGDAVTLSVISGADEANFDIDTATGTVSVPTALDFEDPADTDQDNDYQVSVRATDAVGAATGFTLSIRVTDVTESGTLTRIATGFAQPLFVAPVPGTSLLAVVEKSGLIRTLDPATGAIDGVPLLDVSAEVATDGERGLLGLAFEPGFAAGGMIYVNLTNLSGDTEIRRYRMFAGSSTQADPATGDLILAVDQPGTTHNAGWIGFSNGGLLYIPLGDGSDPAAPGESSQDPDQLLGKVLRVDVTGDDFPADDSRDYVIPPGNAFPGGGGRPEIFALGLRNPFRASVDPVTGDLFIGDVGQNSIEEIDRLPPDGAGTDYGWDTREGTQAFEGPDHPAFTDPVAEYSHGSGPLQGNSVTGGYVYRGAVAEIQNHYVFGDFVSGNYWSVPVDDLIPGSTVPASQFQRLNDLFPPDTGTISNISSFGLDADGDLLLVAYSGSIYRLAPQ